VTDDRVLLITGASSGIGAATARAAAGKYRLVLAARRLEELEKLVEEVGGEEVIAHAPDGLSPEEALAMALLPRLECEFGEGDATATRPDAL
jgi:NADP-dependent 3-hydroxy acid dehydrogenase YdfG